MILEEFEKAVRTRKVQMCGDALDGIVGGGEQTLGDVQPFLHDQLLERSAAAFAHGAAEMILVVAERGCDLLGRGILLCVCEDIGADLVVEPLAARRGVLTFADGLQQKQQIAIADQDAVERGVRGAVQLGKGVSQADGQRCGANALPCGEEREVAAIKFEQIKANAPARFRRKRKPLSRGGAQKRALVKRKGCVAE